MSTPFSYFFQKSKVISPLKHDFTEVLGSIALMPKMLYFYGKMPEKVLIDGVLKRPKSVAIVGARKHTNYGEEVTYRLAESLAREGVVVVSGLAMGIDAVAHRAALDAGGVTVAVLGTAIDEISPRCNIGLAREIIESGGAVLSEYGSGERVFPKTSFLARNRIIAGLADAVIVTEAAERSGSLNTAAHALEQGKDVLVVPGDVTRATSVGCNRLIQQGAMPCLAVEDVRDLLFPARGRKECKRRSLRGDTEVETAILVVLAEGVSDGEKIIAKLGLAVTEFNQTITMLEIKGLVKSLGANNWMLR